MGSAFESIVGAEHVATPTSETIDGVPVSAVISPADAAEVAACLELAVRDGIPLVARGGGTKLGWANLGRADSFAILDLSRLDALVRSDPDEGIVCAQAGARVDELQRQLRAHGRELAIPELPSAATLGGSIAADPPGPRRSASRDLRQDVLGLEVASTAGSLTRCGGQVVKNVTGFDLPRLYCGSLGTLGILTEVTLRLRPLPDFESAVRCELGGYAQLRELCALLSLARTPLDAAVLVVSAASLELIGSLAGSEGDVDDRVRELRASGDAASTLEVVGDRSAFEHAANQHTAWMHAPASEPRVRVRISGRSADLAAMIDALRDWAGSDTTCVAYPLSGCAFAEADASGLEALLAQATSRGWLWTLESASAALKSRLPVFGPSLQAAPLMRAVKRRFDPADVLAPGRYWEGI